MANQMTLKGLIAYLEHDGWGKLFEVVLAEHIDGVADTLDEIAEVTGESDAVLAVWLAAFEDFASRSYGDKGNVVDAYLAKRAFKETPRSRAFLKALRDSVPSLYEVVGAPGGRLTLRDMVRGGEPVTVQDASVSQTDGWVVTRVLSVLGRTELAGTWLDFVEPSDRDDVLTTLTGAAEERPAMAAVTKVWLAGVLEDAALEDEGDEEDGEGMDFVDVVFPLAVGVTAEQVVALLNAQPELRSMDGRTWAWGDEVDEDAFDANYGVIEVSDTAVTYSTVSVIQAQNTMDLVQAWLGELVGLPQMKVTALDDVLADPEMQALLDEIDAEEDAER